MTTQTKGLGKRALDFIEKVGNRLWDPVTSFFVLVAIIMFISLILSQMNVTAVHPGTKATIKAVNLLSKEGLQNFISTITSSFQSFPSLGLVIIVMMGAGLAEKAGLLTAFIKQGVMKAPPNLVTAIVVILGINAVAAGDAGFVILPPLAAAVYLGVGRHPLAGLFTAYASVAGGFAACMMVQMGDVIATSFTIPAAQMVDPNYVGTPAMNFYFMFISSLILLPVGVFVNNKIVEPRLGKYTGQYVDNDIRRELSDTEKKGLKRAGISLLLIIAAFVALSVGDNAFLADPKTGSVFSTGAPMMRGIVPLVTLMFLIPGIVYGKTTGSIKKDRDAVSMMNSSISEIGSFIVLAFAASQFMAVFAQSNMGAIISIKGAEFLQSIGFTGIALLISFILVASFINIFLGSAGAKWAIMAPIFVPMFMMLGYDPALTQICYRIGDSITNPLSPLFTYFPILLGFTQKYDRNAGIGTIVANMLPYSVLFAIAWILLLIVFMIFDLPLGPGGGIYYKY